MWELITSPFMILVLGIIGGYLFQKIMLPVEKGLGIWVTGAQRKQKLRDYSEVKKFRSGTDDIHLWLMEKQSIAHMSYTAFLTLLGLMAIFIVFLHYTKQLPVALGDEQFQIFIVLSIAVSITGNVCLDVRNKIRRLLNVYRNFNAYEAELQKLYPDAPELAP